MKKAKRNLLYETTQWQDYRNLLISLYDGMKASGLTPRYLGKRITKKQIEEVKSKTESLVKKLNIK